MATQDGGLWIGLGYGGADFLKDGHITHYVQPDGVPGGTIWDFAIDHDGSVWAATNGGLARFDGLRFQRIGKDQGFSGESAAALFVDRSGTLWAASENALFFLPQGEKHFLKVADLLGKTSSIAATSDGTLWVSVCCGGNPLQDLTTHAVPIEFPPMFDRAKLPKQMVKLQAVTTGQIDHAGSLWITTESGVFRIPNPEAVSNDRTAHFNGRGFENFTQKDGLTDDAGGGPLIEDRDGNIWVGTNRGLDRFRESNVVAVAPSATRSPLVIGPQGDAWATARGLPHTKFNRMIHFRGMTATVRPLDTAPTAGGQGPNGAIWLAGPGSIARYAGGKETRVPYPDKVDKQRDVQAITEDRLGNLWVSFAGEDLLRRTNGVWKPLGNHIPGNTAVSVTVGSSGRIWLGYMGKRMALIEGERLTNFSSSDGLQVENVEVIDEHGDNVWVGGEHGLALLKNQHFQSIVPNGDAAFDGVTGIVETANGDLWLNAVPGIFRVPAGEIERVIKEPAYHVHCELFGVLDGLDGSALQLRPIPTLVESSDGRLWFSTTGGIVQIDPNHILRNAVPPSVFVRSMDSGGVPYPISGDTALPPRTTSVHFDYTAPNLSVPERVRYRYKLEGSDTGWQDAGTRREAFYTNLGPGHYRFHVIASNNDGVWNTIGNEIAFTIAPAWYQTLWFLTVCVCVLLLMGWMVYRARLRQLQAQFNRTLVARVDERTRIARELHDTLLQSFQGMTLHFQRARNLLPERTPEAMQTLDKALDGAEQAIVEGRDAIHDLRSPAPTAKMLADEIKEFGEELVAKDPHEKEPVQFRMVVEGPARVLRPNAHTDIFRIAREAMRNAFIHSQGHLIETEILFTENLFRLRIRDDGKGIDPNLRGRAERTGHWGLRGMRERAERLGGELEVWSEPGAGTEIELRVPASLAYETAIKQDSSWLFWRRKRDR
jgi:signal transduction histidine kinase/ligand-binding sensor domain-containing protein